MKNDYNGVNITFYLTDLLITLFITTPDKSVVIAKTKKWIVDVVVGCNFCPFAGREVKRESIYFCPAGVSPQSRVCSGPRHKIIQQGLMLTYKS